ncbi:MAG: hypothetical protein HOH95_02650 [Dehalococcoidia bacterium]|jgi:hypothetical protein|nr:hypothetical protein [Dehalococcoidia bacterium]
MVSDQTTGEQTDQAQANGGRQCSGCHRRGATLSLFENGKLYCSNCAGNVKRLGIVPIALDDEPATAAEPSESTNKIDSLDQSDDEIEDDDPEDEEERVVVNESVEPEEIAVMPSLASPELEIGMPLAPPSSASSEVSLHGVLEAERARLLEQRNDLERRFRTDVESIDDRLAHVESLLGEEPRSLAS